MRFLGHIRMCWGVFFSHTIFEVGDGSNIKLWLDLWCGVMPLRKLFLIYIVLLALSIFP
jgi:hypothetical protein